MEPLPLENTSDREEGEIVEDELEDVSDCSLTAGSPLNPGKSVSPPEILNGVCLSRASKRYVRDKSFFYYGKRHQIHRKKRNSQNGVIQKKCKQPKLRRPSIVEIISDSEDEERIDPRYAKQLREALCRDSVDASTNNSLKTRLKALIDTNNSHSEDEAHLNDLRDLALLSTLKPLHLSDDDNEKPPKSKEASDFNPCDISDSIDPELQELRLEALKSVIVKNHERRKRKARKISDNNVELEDINKENDQSIINNKKLKMDVENTTTEIENDLPSVIVTTQGSENIDVQLEEDADVLRAVLLASMSNNLSNNKTIMNAEELKAPLVFPKVVVKPLIINLDSDSDTEATECGPPKPAFKNTVNTVTEFLKRQRAEVEEANVKKKLTTNTHQISTSFNKRNDLANKSVMKLLPRSQQLEYNKLKQQLLNANKRVKTRRNSQKFQHNNKKEVNNVTNSTRKLPFHKTATSLTNNNRIVNTAILKRNGEKKSDSTINHLHNTLNDLQITKNGRLQMKGKYRKLGPLLNKINQASYERQQHEIHIKKMLQELQVSRTQLAKSHQNFTDLVHELVQVKQAIDNSVDKPIAPVVISPVLNDITTSGSKENISKEVTAADNFTYNTEKEKLLDPDDITKVLVNDTTSKDYFTVPKYESPLNYRNNITDPVTIICPYDLLGVCKDKECPYVHYS